MTATVDGVSFSSQLIEKVAQRIEHWKLVAPTVFLLELLSPLGFFGGQVIHLLYPILGRSTEQYAALLEEPENIQRLIVRLEQRNDHTPSAVA